MASRAKTNGKSPDSGKIRYWISFDLGLMGSYNRVYEWLDSLGALECGPGLATIQSTKSRDELSSEIQELVKDSPRARAYIISMGQGGRFVAGGRKAAPWEGFAATALSAVDEA
jgi:hypothetical protein